MNHYDAFSHLKIPITKDTASIKKAYQLLVPQYHPEEDPEGFMRLHEAYKTALAYAQGKKNTSTSSSESFWQPINTRPYRDETGYDSLFDSLNEPDTADLSLQKKVFSRKLLWLRLHWLPIPLKTWAKFFSSEAFLLCRKEPECMKKLYELLAVKIHTYGVFRFLISRLWEVESWQRSEEQDALANKTRTCIKELCGQYSHCMKWCPDQVVTRCFLSPLWYYQALPFYFKMIISTFLLPILSFGSDKIFFELLLVYYILEIIISFRLMSREMGIFFPTVWKKPWAERFNISGNKGLLIVLGIYTILFHAAFCYAFWGKLYG